MPKSWLQCEECAKKFLEYKSNKNGKHIFCGRGCYSKYWSRNISIASKIRGTRNKTYRCNECEIEFQDHISAKRKLCSSCGKKNRFKKGENTGKENGNWKGGRVIINGYVWIYDQEKQRYKQEHRLVMEKHLGRRLKNTEIVHHINEDKQDNRIENLQIVTRKEHIAIHRKQLQDGRKSE